MNDKVGFRISRLRRGTQSVAATQYTASDKLLGLLNEVVCVRDATGIVLYASPAAPAVLGMGPEILVGARLETFLENDDRVAALAHWQRLTGGDSPEAELRWRHPDGIVRWMRMRSMALGGQPSHFATVLLDVTDRRAANTELQQVRNELTGAIAAGPGVLYRLTCTIDHRWVPDFISANVERVTGYTAHEAANPAWPYMAMPLADVTRRWQALEAALEEGMAVVEYRLRAHDDTQLRLRDHIRRLDHPDGRVELVGYLQDVTEIRETELNLAYAREEIETLTATGPGLLYRAETNQAGERQLLFLSNNAERITGFSESDLLRSDWFAAHCDPAATTALAQTLHHGVIDGSATLEFRYRGPGGDWRWVRDSLRVVGRKDQMIQLVGYWADITQEKQQAMQLAEAGKLALLGEMATGMAHELKQPLATITMATENALLALQRTPPAMALATRKLERVLEQTLRTAQLIDHMRIFGRRQDAIAGPVDLGEAVEGAQTIVGGRLHNGQIDLVVDLADDLPPVHGQAVLIEQVLINLLVNACDAYRAAKPDGAAARRIEIRATLRGQMAVMTVTDHAGGIPDAVLRRIFEPFFTTKPPGEGTGLGLSISYGIIRDLGGTLSARNMGDGAVFTLSLPVHDVTVPPAAAAPQQARHQAGREADE